MTRPTAKAWIPPQLHPESAGDVAEDVLDLVAEDDQDHDDDHRDKDQDQRVLDHPLTLVIGERLEEALEDERQFHSWSIQGNGSDGSGRSGEPRPLQLCYEYAAPLSSIDG